MANPRTPSAYPACRTCGSEIVETVNDGLFRDGECDACEYLRYRTQPELLAHLRSIVAAAKAVSASWEHGDLAHAVRSLDRAASAAEVAIAELA